VVVYLYAVPGTVPLPTGMVFGIWYLVFINLFHGAGVLPSGSVVDVIVGVCLEV